MQMKELTRDLAVSVCLGMLLPGLLLNFAAAVWNRALQVQQPQIPEETAAVSGLPVKIRDMAGTVTEGDLEQYLVGVVLGEMPASFESEALKAQSVVARTYARKAYTTGGKHGDGSVCINSACCQAYSPEENYLQQGGSTEGLEKVKQAVYATAGQVLTYEGQLIEATYFSCSGGSTEDASAVWGTEYPYLQAVESPGEEEAAYYQDTVIFTPEQLEEKLGIKLSGSPAAWISAVSYTDGGGVDSIAIGGVYFPEQRYDRSWDFGLRHFPLRREKMPLQSPPEVMGIGWA
jgi:stage II sporulation protein D